MICAFDVFNTINLRDATHFDSEDDYRTGCRNVSHCQQQSYSGLRSSGRLCSAYLEIMKWLVSLNHSLLYSVVSMYILVDQPIRRNTVHDLIDTLSQINASYAVVFLPDSSLQQTPPVSQTALSTIAPNAKNW